MTKPADSKQPSADPVASVPTQRIVTNEAAAMPRRDRKGRFTRTTLTSGIDVALDLPDLSALRAGVPGGLGADVVESFTYAGQRWTAADARANGTPIGLQLAMEQRGRDASGGELKVPRPRAHSRTE